MDNTSASYQEYQTEQAGERKEHQEEKQFGSYPYWIFNKEEHKDQKQQEVKTEVGEQQEKNVKGKKKKEGEQRNSAFLFIPSK